MIKIVALLGLVGVSIVGFSQAAVAAPDNEGGVVGECQLVAQNQLSHNRSTDGFCIRTATNYIAGVAGN